MLLRIMVSNFLTEYGYNWDFRIQGLRCEQFIDMKSNTPII